jgi:phytoene dehydrogenase-like protein
LKIEMSTEAVIDAVVAGAGPNGLAAAITLAKAGLSVKVFEEKDTIGGGARTKELTLPGFMHDVCSSVYPFAETAPFFRMHDFKSHGLEWIFSPSDFAHPLDNGSAVYFNKNERNLEWDKMFGSSQKNGLKLFKDILGPVSFPAHPLLVLKFGMKAMLSAKRFSRFFHRAELKALFAGLAGHSLLPFEKTFSAAPAAALAIAANISGWPIAKGGSQKISDSLASYFKALGGTVETGRKITSLKEIPKAKLVFFDVSLKNFSNMFKDELPARYIRKIEKFRSGPAIFKIDWALSSPVPWKSKAVFEAATVHIGGEFDEIAFSEREVSRGRLPEKPFMIVVQPSLFDNSRAPQGKHVLWGYCHVPLGSEFDMTERMEKQIERFAPGFSDCILQRSIIRPRDLETYNSNYNSGDISGGAMDWPQVFARPTWLHPYKTPIKNVYLCSASTPPGPGVHGMCGYHAAKYALKDLYT